MADATYFVRTGLATGLNDGSSWANAWDGLDTAIDNLPDMSSYTNVYIKCSENGGGIDSFTNHRFTPSNPLAAEAPTNLIIMNNDGAESGTDERPGATWDESNYFTGPSGGWNYFLGFYNGDLECNIKFTRMQFKQTVGSALAMIFIDGDDATFSFSVIGNHFKSTFSANTQYEDCIQLYSAMTGNAYIENNAVYGDGSSGSWSHGIWLGYSVASPSNEYVVANNTVVDCEAEAFTVGWDVSGNEWFLYNNIGCAAASTNNDWDAYNTDLGSSYAATNLHGDGGEDIDKSYVTAISQATETDIFDNYPSDLQSSHSEIAGQGTDIANSGTPPTQYETTDMLGVDRGTSWDIGCFQVAAVTGDEHYFYQRQIAMINDRANPNLKR